MADIVITKINGEQFYRVTANNAKTSWVYVDIWPEQLLGLYLMKNSTVNIALDQGEMWNLSVDGANKSHKVDSVLGDVPTDNNNLIDLIRKLRPNN